MSTSTPIKTLEAVEPAKSFPPEFARGQTNTADSETNGGDQTSEVIDDIAFERAGDYGLLDLLELILKNRGRLDKLIRDPALQPELVPRLLAISLIGFTLFGVAISVVLNSAGTWPELTAIETHLNDPTAWLITFREVGPGENIASRWLDGSALKLILAYNLGLIAATGVCLPSLYFFGLLSGVKLSVLDVTIHSLKAKATAAIALIGILPIYAAISMGMVIFSAPEWLLRGTLWLGLILPFIAGLWGTRSLYVGFAGLSDTMPPERRCRRECFLRRLVLSWSACYTAVTPVMIFTLWEYFGRDLLGT